jgi:S1-C subfamily serine protease
MKDSWLFSIILIVLCTLGGCASVKQQTQSVNHRTSKHYYTSSFPSRDVSKQLQKIQKSVKRISSQAVYTMYSFKSQAVTMKMIQKAGSLDSLQTIKTSVHHGRTGTAVCILKNNKYAAFITANHILAFPDTLIAYRHGKHIPEKKYIASIGIKKKQQNYLIMAAAISPVRILAEDNIQDIALLTVSGPHIKAAHPLPVSVGQAKRLRVGTFVYILGYPLGAPMVTRAIVSDPNYDNRNGFLSDAVYNHGISGGLIIASKNNFRNFQWVGMAVSASATQQLYLVPDPSKIGSYWNHELYTDSIYISKKMTINYGFTESTPTEQIMAFLYGQTEKLQKLGLHVKNMY